MASHAGRTRPGQHWPPTPATVVTAAVVALVAGFVTMLLVGPGSQSAATGDAPGTSPVAASATAGGGSVSHVASGPAARLQGSTSLDPRWSRVLDHICAQRARAWRLGEPRQLKAVYVAGSPELVHDQAMLRAYLRRGLRVSDVRMQFTVVVVERQAPDRASLLVVDRLAPAVAHDTSGHARPLPRDLPTRHLIRLAMTERGWRIAGITVR